MKTSKFFLIALFATSFIMRIAFFLYFTSHGSNAWIYVDSDQYLAIATQIASGNGISLDGIDPQYYRLPGYPLFLALCYFIVRNVNCTLVVQIILSSLIPLLVFFLSLTLIPHHLRIARCATLFSVVHLGFVLYSGMLATESLSLLFLLIFYLFFFRIMHSSEINTYDALSAGASLGVVSLIRPVGLYVILLALVLMVLQKCNNVFLNGFLFIASWLTVVSPWLLRNLLLTGAVFFHSLPGLHFMQYTAADIVMRKEGYAYSVARTHVLDAWHKKITEQEGLAKRPLDDYERCVIGEKLALSYVITHPIYALQHMFIEMFKTCAGLYSAVILLADGASWPDYGNGVTWKKKIKRFLMPVVKRSLLRWYIYFEILAMMFLFVGCGLFFLRCITSLNARALLFKIAPFCLLFIGLTLAYGGARLRMPIEPLIIIAAFYGFIGRHHDKAHHK